MKQMEPQERDIYWNAQKKTKEKGTKVRKKRQCEIKKNLFCQ